MNEFEKFEEQGGKVNLRVSPELRKKIKQVSLDRKFLCKALWNTFCESAFMPLTHRQLKMAA